jgi:hypothetical protein
LNSEVYLSQAFTELFTYALHAIFNRDVFDAETILRSRKFESEVVKKEFESKGFRYIANHVVWDFSELTSNKYLAEQIHSEYHRHQDQICQYTRHG